MLKSKLPLKLVTTAALVEYLSAPANLVTVVPRPVTAASVTTAVPPKAYTFVAANPLA